MLATDGHAYFEKDGKVYHIYTQVPKQTPPEYRLLQAPKIDELSLDHDNPVEKELKKAICSMPTLQLLSTDIQIFKQNPVGKLYERLGFIPSGETEFHYQMMKPKEKNYNK